MGKHDMTEHDGNRKEGASMMEGLASVEEADAPGEKKSNRDWNDAAHDQITALLGDTQDATLEEDHIDLSALRRALAQKQESARVEVLDQEPTLSPESQAREVVLPDAHIRPDQAQDAEVTEIEQRSRDVSAEEADVLKNRLNWLIDFIKHDEEEATSASADLEASGDALFETSSPGHAGREEVHSGMPDQESTGVSDEELEQEEAFGLAWEAYSQDAYVEEDLEQEEDGEILNLDWAFHETAEEDLTAYQEGAIRGRRENETPLAWQGAEPERAGQGGRGRGEDRGPEGKTEKIPLEEALAALRKNTDQNSALTPKERATFTEREQHDQRDILSRQALDSLDETGGDGYPEDQPAELVLDESFFASMADELDSGEELVSGLGEEARRDEDAPAEDQAPGKQEEELPKVVIPPVELKKITSKDRVVASLLRKDLVTHAQIKAALSKQKNEGIRESLWRVLTTVSGVNRAAIFEDAAAVYAFTIADVDEGEPDPDFARSIMHTFEEEYRDRLLKMLVLPYRAELDQQSGQIKVVFVTHDPTRPDLHKIMQKLKLERFELRYAPESVVAMLILEAFPKKNEFLERFDEASGAFDLGLNYDEKTELVDEDALEAEISRSKLINLFEATLVEAVRQGASDVHIWPNANKHVEIHFRVDGRLQRWHMEKSVHPEALIAVIKDNSMNVDRFERDSAQDGFIQRWIDEALIRFRVSVLPIANAAADVRSESIVIRVLDDRKVVKDLRALGLNESAYDRFMKAIHQPHGMVILTGPTGSGKTTTLYASIHAVISPEVNILTVEDPVEYILPGVRQIKLNHKLGLEGALRSILRHDPDVVMVGEMRDKATAELAIKLANTGHLTFSTLHTNDAASAVTRLYKMGIEPFLIAYAINLVVAQRLIRRLCPHCKQVDPDPDPIFLKNLGFSPEEIAETTFYMPGEDDACPTCKGLGFKGRRAVTEAMYFSREIRHLIADSEGKLDEHDIKDMAVKQGMLTLQDSARVIVKAGDTSVQEMLRVVSSED